MTWRDWVTGLVYGSVTRAVSYSRWMILSS